MKKHDFLKALLASLAVIWVLFGNCKKETPDPIIGSWKVAAPFIQQPGYWFYEDGMMCRYEDRCLPDSVDCQYTYTKHENRLHISGYADIVTWEIEWISDDFIRVRVPQTEHLTNIIFLERDKWE